MNNAFSKRNIIYIILKSFILVALIILFRNWRQNNLVFQLSFDQIADFVLMFLISFFVILIIEVIKENK